MSGYRTVPVSVMAAAALMLTSGGCAAGDPDVPTVVELATAADQLAGAHTQPPGERITTSGRVADDGTVTVTLTAVGPSGVCYAAQVTIPAGWVVDADPPIRAGPVTRQPAGTCEVRQQTAVGRP